MPEQVIEAMAKRPMRMHHALWHISRQGWSSFPEATRAVFREHGWEPPRPALTINNQIECDNAAGEDFLFMHRQMIGEVNKILAELGDPRNPRVQGWQSIPTPSDAEYPVPAPFVTGDAGLDNAIASAKTEEAFTRIRQWEDQFTDTAVLRRMTLGQLGAAIEFTIHNRMHLRWAARQPEYRVSTDPFNVNPKWDKPSYDFLADFYSSHVNPIFWKLHGWVDARIDDWMEANQHNGPVPWTVTPWVGPMTSGHEHHHIARHALRTPGDEGEAEALSRQVDALEATINDVKATGTPEPTPFLVDVDWSFDRPT
ncbi:Tat pathway signal protein [Micromonospora viridifaciens]|uniref:Tat pathway signal protein n=1 Tax=Micromonospora viridifaciens TaxID=1881 RepID=UPI0012FD85C4|nr:Tat pathway signal protein [Micromonospora viridifaciens]